MLGVIIGVGSVIIMISIVQGARQKVVEDFKGDGANLLFAFYSPKRDNERRGTFEGLRMDDVHAIESQLSVVESISPESQQGIKATHGKKTYSATAVGITPAYFDVTNVKLASGRLLDDRDLSDWDKVCILGDKVREELFGKEDAIGKQIVIDSNGLKILLTVVGLLERKGKGFGQSPDEQLLVPLTTLQKRLTGSNIINSFNATAATGINAEEAADLVFTVLKQRHPDNAQDFVVDTQEGLLQRLDMLLMTFQLILGGVGGLSLLVGGIGIMNIMLVSVTERTREIGIRKAVGAKRGDILLQFITESMTVSGMGGLLGVGFGYGVSRLIGAVAGENLRTYVPPWAALLGFGFAVSIGMFFGIYPAFRAAKLDPIQALRYE